MLSVRVDRAELRGAGLLHGDHSAVLGLLRVPSGPAELPQVEVLRRHVYNSCSARVKITTIIDD